MSIRRRRIALCLAAMLPGLALAYAPTPHAMNLYGYAALNEKPAPVGTLIQAFDPQGVECGDGLVNAIDMVKTKRAMVGLDPMPSCAL